MVTESRAAQLTEARIAVALGVPLDVLLPQDLQRDVLALQLAVNCRPVGLGEASVALLLADRRQTADRERALFRAEAVDSDKTPPVLPIAVHKNWPQGGCRAIAKPPV
jgi:hypothetical protein